MAIQGSLKDMTVADLIMHSCRDHKTTRLKIEHEGRAAILFFKEGTVHHAVLGQDQGEEVIYHILGWEEGQFTLEPGPPPPATTIARSWSALLLEGARRLDEGNDMSTDQIESFMQQDNERSQQMAKKSNVQDILTRMMEIDGAIAAALVDWSSGMTLGTIGNGLNIEVAAAGNADVVRAKFQVMESLGIQGSIEDILITLQEQYHLIRPLSSNLNLFMYLALNRNKANLGMARHRLAQAESDLVV